MKGTKFGEPPSYSQASNLEGPNYTTTEGTTAYFFQPDFKKIYPEEVIRDNSPSFSSYPFNVNTETPIHQQSPIKTIKIKCDGCVIQLSKEKISSNNPIFIEIVGTELRIWNSEVKERRALTSKGSTEVQGYNILDFDGKTVKISHPYTYRNWLLACPAIFIEHLTIHGSNCNYTFSPESLIFSTNSFTLKIYGNNQIKLSMPGFQSMPVAVVNKIDLFSTYSTIDCENFVVNDLRLEVEGCGKIQGLVVNSRCDVKLVGDCSVDIRKTKDDVEVKQELYGGPKLDILNLKF